MVEQYCTAGLQIILVLSDVDLLIQLAWHIMMRAHKNLLSFISLFRGRFSFPFRIFPGPD